MKKCTWGIVLLAVLLLLTSCGNRISSDEARTTANDFLRCLAEDRYEDALALMHPDYTATAAELEAYITDIEEETETDFSSGIGAIQYTGFSSSLYTSDIDGARYELSGTFSVADHNFGFRIEIGRNDAGYGIYNIHITP